MRIVLVTLLVLIAAPAFADPIAPGQIRVVDGDTIRVLPRAKHTRLVGFNAPETRRAKCPAERAEGVKADRRLRELVAGGQLDLEFVRCACSAKTLGTEHCNYGRTCAVLKARGRDVGQVLIAEKLAVPFQCGPTRCPATPRPWCG